MDQNLLKKDSKIIYNNNNDNITEALNYHSDNSIKLAKWLSCVVSTYLYGAFEYIQMHLIMET